MTRTDIRNLCGKTGCHIFEKIEDAIDEALKRANKSPMNITKVILTGGSSKWFFMESLVSSKFGLTTTDDSIYLTQNPYTDVAYGCALFIGMPTTPNIHDGIWCQCKIGEMEDFSKHKILIKPTQVKTDGRSDKLYLGSIEGTSIWKPCKIEIVLFSGPNIDNLHPIGNPAIIEYYARSNHPTWEKFRKMSEVWKNHPTDKFNDQYDIYLYAETIAGIPNFKFEILDSYAAKIANDNENKESEQDKSLPEGHYETGDVIPGFVSYRGGLFGKRERKLIKIKE